MYCEFREEETTNGIGTGDMSGQRLILNDGEQHFDWEWVWETEETYSEFNFHDYSRPYQEMETLYKNKAEDLSSIDWLLDFQIDNYHRETLSPLQTLCERTHSISNLPVSSTGLIDVQVLDQKAEGEKGSGSIWKTCTSKEKPSYNYNELIEQALLDKGKLTVDGIYQWIAGKYPYYKLTEAQWKGCVRHRLSINRAFVKVEKVGKCHLWTYKEPERRTKPAASAATMKHIKNHWKKQKLAELEKERKKNEEKENALTKQRKRADTKQGRNEKRSKGTFRESSLKMNTMEENFGPNLSQMKQHRPTMMTSSLETTNISSLNPGLLLTACPQDPRTVFQGFQERPLDLMLKENVVDHEREKIFGPLHEDKPVLPMQLDINLCRILSTETLPSNIRSSLDADNTFLNPVSFREQIVESGLLDDPPSTRMMSIIPNPQFQVPMVEMDTPQLFSELLMLN